MKCHQCDRENELHTSWDDSGDKPHDGAVSMCFNCGFLEIFANNATELREPTSEEYAMLMEDEGIRTALHQLTNFWLSQAEDRIKAECGCCFGTYNNNFIFLPCSETCDMYAYSIEQARKTQKTIATIDIRDNK